MKWIAIVFGIGGIACNFAIYQQKTRKKLLFLKLIANCLWTFHYTFLGAFSGAAICSIGILRESIFLNNHRKWARSKLWLVLFVLLSIVSAILTWKNPYSILPSVASVLSVYSFWKGRPDLTRVLSFPISISFLIYNIVSASYVGILNEIFVLVSTIIAIFKTGPKFISKSNSSE